MQKSFKSYLRSIKTSLGFAFRIVPTGTLIMFILFFAIYLIPYASSYALGNLVNSLVKIVSNKTAVGEISLILLTYAVISALPSILGTIRVFVWQKWRFQFETFMEIFMLRKRAEAGVANYENPEFQDLLLKVDRRGFVPIRNLAEQQFSSFADVLSLVVGSILAIKFGWQIYLIILISSVPRFITELKYGQRIWNIWSQDSPEQRRLGNLRNYFRNRSSIVETILLQTTNWLLRWAEKILHEFNKKNIQAEKSRFYELSFSHIISIGGFTWVMYIIVNQVLNGSIPVGQMIFVFGVISSLRGAMIDFLVDTARQYEDYTYVESLDKFFNIKPIVELKKNPTKIHLDNPPEIIFENVSFKYQNSDKYSLQNLTLTLKPGDKIGLVGNNGAGKTTFVKLLCRIYDPTEGRILINGIDLKDVDTEEWWSYLGVMLQEYSSYDFITKQAIAVGRADPEIDIEKVRNAAHISQSHQFIEEWKEKYENPIGLEFGGVEPSKGQRQKLSIAKIVYRNPLVMILDEPTASVDAESEAKIFDSLENLPQSMTALLISHDFSTISECDKIFVLDEGKLKEEGDHNNLMKKEGLYAKLYNLQAERFQK